MKLAPSTAAALAAIGLGAVLAVWLLRKLPDSPGEAGAALGRAAGEAASGVVLGIGDAVGLPRTDKSACQLKVEAFRSMSLMEQAVASFSLSATCSAGDYLRFVATGKGPDEP